jgi:cysteine dioxygenase
MNPATIPTTPAKGFPALRPLLAYLDSLDRRADLAMLRSLLGDLEVTRVDLAPACLFSRERYQRNVIRRTPWYELVCLCWLSGQRTPIHNHTGSSCAFRVVEGLATETRFERTASGLVVPSWTKTHQPGYVCAAADADIHQVANAQAEGRELVTLHIYSPQLRGFQVFSLDTPCAWSEGAVRTDRS